MKTPSPPAAPDPAATAAAQSQMNRETAITQYGLNATNQVTPQGSLTYEQIGKWDDGTPRYQATQTYSPTEQGIYETDAKTRQNLSDIGESQSSKIGTLLNTPYSLNEATQNKIAGLQKSFLDPQWTEQEDRLKTQLINSGVRPGSEAYTRAMRDFSTDRQRAYDQSYLDAYKTAEASSLTERNQPINEITALMSGSQVSNPTYGATPSVGVAPTDLIGAQQQSLNQQNLGYNAQVQNQQGMMSGLFGLGKTALGGWMMSDRRLKEDVKKVGRLNNGLPIYSFKYKDGGLMQLGLMAQDVEKEVPDAVAETDSGYKAVNYSTVAEAV
jgi:hypothetical protein